MASLLDKSDSCIVEHIGDGIVQFRDCRADRPRANPGSGRRAGLAAQDFEQCCIKIITVVRRQIPIEANSLDVEQQRRDILVSTFGLVEIGPP
jgi:hypothetical protein